MEGMTVASGKAHACLAVVMTLSMVDDHVEEIVLQDVVVEPVTSIIMIMIKIMM